MRGGYRWHFRRRNLTLISNRDELIGNHHMTIRAYTPEDFPLIEEWAKARDMAMIPQLLSPNGFIVEDESGPFAVCFVYLAFGCPIASLDNLFTKPGTSFAKCRKGWPILWRTILSFLSNLRTCDDVPLSYKIVRIYTRTPLARFLRNSEGWSVSEHTSTQAIYAIP